MSKLLLMILSALSCRVSFNRSAYGLAHAKWQQEGSALQARHKRRVVQRNGKHRQRRRRPTVAEKKVPPRTNQRSDIEAPDLTPDNTPADQPQRRRLPRRRRFRDWPPRVRSLPTNNGES